MRNNSVYFLFKFRNILDWIILGLVAYFTNLPNFIWFMFYHQAGGTPQLQLVVLFFLVVITLIRLRLENKEGLFYSAIRKNWFVGLFVIFTFVSLIWSVSVPITIYRSLLVLFTAIIGAYFGIHFSDRNIVTLIAVVFGIFALVSLSLIIFFPTIGISSDPAYLGLWQGIFWHKIYLGASMALLYISLLTIIFSKHNKNEIFQTTIGLVLLLICIILAIKSDSASGLVLFSIQTILFLLLFIWMKWGHLVSRKMYWIIGGLLLLFTILLLSNLSFLFALFNRSAQMTGRVPMWLFLFDEFISKAPFVGYGFGAFWMQPGMMQKVQSVVGWPYPVRVSDNGYLDVILGLGVAGLSLIIVMLATGIWRALKHGLNDRQLHSFFPLFVLVHIFFINISLSYFFEGEYFIWFLLVLILFSLSKTKQIIREQT